jgi:hypothetical protein
MKLKKGDRIHFIQRDEIEVVEKGSSDSVMGEIRTNKNTYSLDFILHWKYYGFLKILPRDEKGEK